MKIFLNLISVKTGGQIIRASKFIEKTEKDSSKTTDQPSRSFITPLPDRDDSTLVPFFTKRKG